MNAKKWKIFKKSGTFRRKVKRFRDDFKEEISNGLTTPVLSPNSSRTTLFQSPTELHETNVPVFNCNIQFKGQEQLRTSNGLDIYETPKDDFSESNYDEVEFYSPDEESGNEIDDIVDTSKSWISFLQNWAINYNIRQAALKPLIAKLNESLNVRLVRDPRTLLKTNYGYSSINEIAGGHYWHQGLEVCLRLCFSQLKNSTTIEINVNMDGLPIFKNGRDQLWPILFNVHTFPKLKPMVIGLFYGKSKPKKVEEYLQPFVDEYIEILNKGIFINGYKLEVKIRSFICDSPARAFIKGVQNFNGLHGCLKCCTVGVHSTYLGCTIFPNTIAAKRTDAGFRARAYGDHHAVYKIAHRPGRLLKTPIYSPLLRLPIDMVEDIIVGDSLHLLHLGILKRLLTTYLEGHKGYEGTTLSKASVLEISSIISKIKVPFEIHRQVRSLIYLTHWKASECATFLNYVGVALLKNYLPERHYDCFLTLFSAVTICSTKYFRRFLTIAANLFTEYVTEYYELFNTLTSNVHNLVHIVDEVNRFGPLPSISSYPFENELYQLKRMLRSGRYPLRQIVNRISEKAMLSNNSSVESLNYPVLKKPMERSFNKFCHVIIRESVNLTSQFQNKWFLTTQKKIVAMIYATKEGIYGKELFNWTNAFHHPLQSDCINVFKTSNNSKFKTEKLYSYRDILCKFFAIENTVHTFFIPIHHTYVEEFIL